MIYAKIYIKQAKSPEEMENLTPENMYCIAFMGDDKQIGALNVPDIGITDKSQLEVYDYLAENGFMPVNETFFFKI